MVSRFEQTWTQVAVNFDGSTDNISRDLIDMAGHVNLPLRLLGALCVSAVNKRLRIESLEGV